MVVISVNPSTSRLECNIVTTEKYTKIATSKNDNASFIAIPANSTEVITADGQGHTVLYTTKDCPPESSQLLPSKGLLVMNGVVKSEGVGLVTQLSPVGNCNPVPVPDALREAAIHVKKGTLSLAMGSPQKYEMKLKAKVTVFSRQNTFSRALNIKE